MSPLEAKLRQLAASFDDGTLEALASKGLLRRAQKDLERDSEIRVDGEHGTAVQVAVGEHRVLLPEAGPAKATCSCPAAGVCQHILTAVLFLRHQASAPSTSETPTAPAANPLDEIMRCTAESLEQWAGKAAYRMGLKIASQGSAGILMERGLRVRLNLVNAECHVVPGTGLDGVIVSCGKGDPRAFVVAAVIAVQQANGVPWAAAEAAGVLDQSAGAPRGRVEVLSSCQSLLADTLANGLSRLSPANQQRWATLAVSALGVNLPRLALVLRAISDEVMMSVARDARADPGRMLGRLSQAHALCTAMQHAGESPRADLVGVHRSQYLEVGNLDLTGVAAWPWQTQSGYEGLTVLFWDHAANRWCSWSDSRPKHQLGGFSAVARYNQASPWEGAESPRQLARSSFRLMNARRNAAFRLSSSSRSRALITGPGAPGFAQMPVYTEWNKLADHLGAHEQIGLREPDPLASVVALRPAVWGERAFDSVRQVFQWTLFDAGNNGIRIELAFDALTEPAIGALEAMEPESLKDSVLIGRASNTRIVTVFPFSLYRPAAGLTCLALDSASVSASSAPTDSSNEMANDPEWEMTEEDNEDGRLISPLVRLLDELDDNLLALAESGTAGLSFARLEKLRQVADAVERRHIDVFARGLERFSMNGCDPETLLRCVYISHLCRRASSVGRI